MKDGCKPFDSKYVPAILDKLVQCGWIEEYGVHDPNGKYVFKWTAKGLQRSRWVKEISMELNLGPEGMCALLVICEQHAPWP
jgi:hypothetical protein